MKISHFLGFDHAKYYIPKKPVFARFLLHCIFIDSYSPARIEKSNELQRITLVSIPFALELPSAFDGYVA